MSLRRALVRLFFKSTDVSSKPIGSKERSAHAQAPEAAGPAQVPEPSGGQGGGSARSDGTSGLDGGAPLIASLPSGAMDLLDSVFSRDPEIAAGALERLCEGVKNDVVLAAALGAHPRLLPRLRVVLLEAAATTALADSGGGGGGSQVTAASSLQALQRLAMYSAYLVSVLTGKGPAIDARLLDQRFVPALAEAAAAGSCADAGAVGVKRGALRALSKLLEAQPACAAAQLVACGGVEAVAAMLPGDGCARGNCGISRRCMAILHATLEVAPGGAAAASLLKPEPLSALLKVLGCARGDAQREAAALLLLLLGKGGEGAARLAASAGAGPALAAVARGGDDDAAREFAARALRSIEQQVGPCWRQLAAPAQHATAHPLPPRARLAASLQRATTSVASLRPHFGTPAGQPPLVPRAGSAPLPAAPEGAGQRAQRAESPFARGSMPASLARAGSGGLSNSFARVQSWQHPGMRSPSPAGGPGNGRPTSVADLVAALSGGFPRAQLEAAEQLGALAASGGRSAAVIASAGGVEALVVCVCDSAAGPIDIQDTMADAFEAALSQSVCTAALRTLCALVQQSPDSAAGLPPAAAAVLHLLLAGPDAQQRQLAEVLLGAMQEAGLDPMVSGTAGFAHASRLLEPAAQRAPLAAGTGGRGTHGWNRSIAGSAAAARTAGLSPDLLASDSISPLSELPPVSVHNQRGTAQHSVDGSAGMVTPQAAPGSLPRRFLSTGSPAVPAASLPAPTAAWQESSLYCAGGTAGASVTARKPQPLELGRLPSQIRRQLGEQLQLMQRPAARSPLNAEAGEEQVDVFDAAQPAQGAGVMAGGQLAPGQRQLPPQPELALSSGQPSEPALRSLWGVQSDGSAAPSPAATPSRSQSSGLWAGSDAGASGGGGPPASQGSLPLGHQPEAEGAGGLMLSRSDIDICKDPSGREWRLGEGGFGVVYKGLMNGVDEVAVKCIKAETPSDAELALFYREMHTLASLRHRNLVQYYGACLEPGSLMIVTELLKGGDLYSAMRRHPEALAWGRLGRKVALDVALGINHLHSRRPSLSHRDLKSPNVLLSEEGVAKIADVGMLRRQASELITAQPVMTPLWSAPEVLRRERAGIKADIFGFGVICWEIATGRDITECQPLAITRQMGAEGQAPQPADSGAAPCLEMPPDAPAVARHIFEACTQLDPALRPNAAQLVEWLRAAGA